MKKIWGRVAAASEPQLFNLVETAVGGAYMA
jgi:hypothetical protein